MLDIYPFILETVTALRPVTGRIARADTDLGRQLRRAQTSVALNVAEGAYSRGRNRQAESFDASMYCSEDEVTVLYEDELNRGQSVALPFPLPEGVGNSKVEARWTLSDTTDVDPRDSLDYTLSGIEAIFRPDSRVRSLTNPKTRSTETVRVDQDAPRIAAAPAEGWTLSDEPTHSQWLRTRSEQRLRRDGKWETLVPGRVLPAPEGTCQPRIDLHYLRRANGQLVGGSAVPTPRFALLLTLRCMAGSPLYDRVRNRFEVLAPLAQVPVRVNAAS